MVLWQAEGGGGGADRSIEEAGGGREGVDGGRGARAGGAVGARGERAEREPAGDDGGGCGEESRSGQRRRHGQGRLCSYLQLFLLAAFCALFLNLSASYWQVATRCVKLISAARVPGAHGGSARRGRRDGGSQAGGTHLSSFSLFAFRQ
eukprot:1567461-Rhodomonas_salina.2